MCTTDAKKQMQQNRCRVVKITNQISRESLRNHQITPCVVWFTLAKANDIKTERAHKDSSIILTVKQ